MHLSAFERLVHQYQDRVYGFACHLLGSREDARDVTQDVLIRLWQRGTDDEHVLPWLMRVTRNTCIDVLRRRKLARDTFVDGLEADELPYDGVAPTGSLEREDARRIVASALQCIDEPYRSVVILREIQQMKYEAISGAMDMPMNTVKVYLHRGRKMLREALTEMMEREHV